MSPNGIGGQKRINKYVLFLSLFILALLYLRIVFLPVETTINLVPDDALFYFQVAKNFAYSNLITFDGIEPATGFHPGWMFLIFSIYKPISLFMKFEPKFFYRIGFGISLFFIIISIALGLKWLRSRFDIPLFIFPVFIMVLGLKFIWNVGLETEVLIALLVCHLILQARANLLASAAFAALIVFFRMDMVGFFLILAVVGWVLKVRHAPFCHSEERSDEESFSSLRTTSRFFASLRMTNSTSLFGSILGFGLAMLFYYIVSGYPFSMSMYLKGGIFDIDLAAIERNFRFFERFDLYMALVSVILFIMIPKDERKRLSPLYLYVFSLFLLLLFHIFFNRLCAPWYFKPFRYFLVLSFFALASVLWRNKTRGLSPLLVIVLILLPLIFSIKWIYMAASGKYDGGETQVYQFSNKIKDKITEPVFVRDYSGIVAFFSDKKTINGDGLINTREFIQDYLLAGLVREYIKERQVKNCVFSYSLSEYKQFEKQGSIFEQGCPFFLRCLPNGFHISKEKIIWEDCSKRWDKCLVLVDCGDL